VILAERPRWNPGEKFLDCTLRRYTVLATALEPSTPGFRVRLEAVEESTGDIVAFTGVARVFPITTTEPT